jgi:hypothetical protein
MKIKVLKNFCMGLVLFFITFPAFGADETAPKIDPKAEQILKQMSEYLAKQPLFGLRVTEYVDELSDEGYPVELVNVRKALVKRPDRILGDVEGDNPNRAFWYDGKTVTVLDRKANVYATTEVSNKIDAMLDYMVNEYDLVLPLVDFLYSNVYDALTEQVESGRYLGLHTLGERKAHHLVFRQVLVDWQIWIDEGEAPLPRKLMIHYKRERGCPRYTVVFEEWNLSPQVKDEAFQFVTPADALKVEFSKVMPASGATQEEKRE